MIHGTLLQRMMQAHFYQSETGGGNGAPESDYSIADTMPTETPGAPTPVPVDNQVAYEEIVVTPTVEVTTEPAPVVEVEEGGIGTIGLVIVAIVAILAVLAAALVVLKRKPKPDAEATAAMTDATVPNTAVDANEPATLQMAPPTLHVGHKQHIGRRSDQQDNYAVSAVDQASRKGLLAVVCDGMGGMSDGAAISKTAVSAILTGFQTLPVEQNPPLQLMRLAGSAHNAVCSMPSFGQGGSTLVMAYIWDSWLFTLSIGDSRMYLMRDHTLMQLNREHTYAVELDEKAALGEISLEQALNDPQRKALTSYLGIEELQKIDRTLRPFPLRRGDRIALMSDGVFGTISDSEIQVLLELPPEQAVQQIEQAVLLKNQPRQDNLTVVVISYE